MTPRTFHIVGAFNRFNYGDILFAHLSRQFIQSRHPEAAVAFYSTYGADLRPAGGVATQGIRALFSRRMTSQDVVWVAGGDVLATRWHLMAEHALPPLAARLLRALRGRVGTEPINRLVQWMAGVPNRMPWVLDPRSFRDAEPKVIYLSNGAQGVGGLPAPVLDWERAALQRATWLSVRDRKSLAGITDLIGEPARLMPDNAVLMRDLPEASEPARAARLRALLPKISAALAPEGYICLQCGALYFEAQEDLLARQLTELHSRTGLPVLSFAIGTAAGHEDQVAMAGLEARLGATGWFHRAPQDLDIWQIMALIAGSAGYLGTSLHGYITAFAFSVPRLGLSPKVGKLMGFVADWDLPEMQAGVTFEALPAVAEAALARDPQTLRQQAEVVTDQARAALAELWQALETPVAAE